MQPDLGSCLRPMPQFLGASCIGHNTVSRVKTPERDASALFLDPGQSREAVSCCDRLLNMHRVPTVWLWDTPHVGRLWLKWRFGFPPLPSPNLTGLVRQGGSYGVFGVCFEFEVFLAPFSPSFLCVARVVVWQSFMQCVSNSALQEPQPPRGYLGTLRGPSTGVGKQARRSPVVHCDL